MAVVDLMMRRRSSKCWSNMAGVVVNAILIIQIRRDRIILLMYGLYYGPNVLSRIPLIPVIS